MSAPAKRNLAEKQIDVQFGLRGGVVKQEPVTVFYQNIFRFLVAFRLVNALCIKTFFQPDEYFQSLEPAWEIAFGSDHGAWITWARKLPKRCAVLGLQSNRRHRNGRIGSDPRYIPRFSPFPTGSPQNFVSNWDAALRYMPRSSL